MMMMEATMKIIMSFIIFLFSRLYVKNFTNGKIDLHLILYTTVRMNHYFVLFREEETEDQKS